jgi:hypothetical protein
VLGLYSDAFSAPGYFQNCIGRSSCIGHREIDCLPGKDPTTETDDRWLVQHIGIGIMRRRDRYDDVITK